MEKRKLGLGGLEVSAIGLGCMGMAGVSGMKAMYGAVDMDEAVATLHRAIDIGIDFGWCQTRFRLLPKPKAQAKTRRVSAPREKETIR